MFKNKDILIIAGIIGCVTVGYCLGRIDSLQEINDIKEELYSEQENTRNLILEEIAFLRNPIKIA